MMAVITWYEMIISTIPPAAARGVGALRLVHAERPEPDSGKTLTGIAQILHHD